MEFCPTCRMMLYTKLGDSDIESEDNKKILLHYCKSCDWSGVIDNDSSKPIYKRCYNEDYIVDKVLSNNYTMFDVTLPRIEYDCINENCSTNIDIEGAFPFMITNIPADYTDEQFEQFKNLIDDGLPESVFRNKKTTAIILCTSEENREARKKRYSELFKQDDLKDLDLSIIEYKKPMKEVLYIKYDTINMKYLYLCANCGTSWK